MTSKVAIGACVWALAMAVRAAAPLQDSGAPAATRSTTTGVYTGAQADAGQEIFAATCIGGCHSLSDHKGVAFKQRWAGHVVWELYHTIHEEMPKDDPGSLSDADAINLVAYLLKINGLPAGKDALATDESTLRKIKIDVPEGGDRPRGEDRW